MLQFTGEKNEKRTMSFVVHFNNLLRYFFFSFSHQESCYSDLIVQLSFALNFVAFERLLRTLGANKQASSKFENSAFEDEFAKSC